MWRQWGRKGGGEGVDAYHELRSGGPVLDSLVTEYEAGEKIIAS